MERQKIAIVDWWDQQNHRVKDKAFLIEFYVIICIALIDFLILILVLRGEALLVYISF